MHIEDEREPIFGYDFAFAPYQPLDPEYRQVYMGLQTKWLAEWAPPVGYWPQ